MLSSTVQAASFEYLFALAKIQAETKPKPSSVLFVDTEPRKVSL